MHIGSLVREIPRANRVQRQHHHRSGANACHIGHASTDQYQKIFSGKIAALNRYISRSSDKIKPFTAMLKGDKKIMWTPECEEAFQKLKVYLTSPPTLSVLKIGETMYVYLAKPDFVVSSVFVRDNGKIHSPIFYLSQILGDTETRYTKIEKYII